jgi:hypothetical protein
LNNIKRHEKNEKNEKHEKKKKNKLASAIMKKNVSEDEILQLITNSPIYIKKKNARIRGGYLLHLAI